MGKYNCRYHGGTGMIFTCRHIKQNLSDRVKTEPIITALFPDSSNIDGRFKLDIELYYCGQCVTERDFPPQNGKFPEENFSSMYEQGFGPACYDCFRELNL